MNDREVLGGLLGRKVVVERIPGICDECEYEDVRGRVKG